MSLVSNALGTALSVVSTAKDEALAYRSTPQRAWVTLTGFVLDRDDEQEPVFDEGDNAQATVSVGRLSGPLTPVLAEGYQVRDGAGDVWAVVNAELDQQQICRVRLTTLDNAGPNRGGAV